MPKSTPPQATPAQVHHRFANGLLAYKEGEGVSACWIYKATNAELRAIASHLGVPRGNLDKAALIAACIEKDGRLA